MLGENKVACSLNFHACFILLLTYSPYRMKRQQCIVKSMNGTTENFLSPFFCFSFLFNLSYCCLYSTSLQQMCFQSNRRDKENKMRQGNCVFFYSVWGELWEIRRHNNWWKESIAVNNDKSVSTLCMLCASRWPIRFIFMITIKWILRMIILGMRGMESIFLRTVA